MAAKRASGASRMSKAHKDALATGRNESRAVRGYLEVLAANKPKRGRKRTTQSVQKRLSAIDAALASADRVTTLKLAQERIDLLAELDAMDADNGLAELESSFVAVAANYSARQGITYAAWRHVGVTPDVLRRAGIGRSS
jgi:hypothetical protein